MSRSRLTRGQAERRIAANLVIVADQGMAEVLGERANYLDDIAPAELGAPLAMASIPMWWRCGRSA